MAPRINTSINCAVQIVGSVVEFKISRVGPTRSDYESIACPCALTRHDLQWNRPCLSPVMRKCDRDLCATSAFVVINRCPRHENRALIITNAGGMVVTVSGHVVFGYFRAIGCEHCAACNARCHRIGTKVGNHNRPGKWSGTKGG